jgi:hypothetical protein
LFLTIDSMTARRAVDRAVEDDAAHGLPVLHRHLGEGLVGTDRRVVDEDVDAAELRHRLGDHRIDLILPGNVGDDGDRLDTAGPSLLCDRIGLRLVGPRVDDDVRAFRGQLQDRRAPDVAARAGHQGHLAFELAHEHSSRPHGPSFSLHREPDGTIGPS